jgi:hypothetical protein
MGADKVIYIFRTPAFIHGSNEFYCKKCYEKIEDIRNEVDEFDWRIGEGHAPSPNYPS